MGEGGTRAIDLPQAGRTALMIHLPNSSQDGNLLHPPVVRLVAYILVTALTESMRNNYEGYTIYLHRAAPWLGLRGLARLGHHSPRARLVVWPSHAPNWPLIKCRPFHGCLAACSGRGRFWRSTSFSNVTVEVQKNRLTELLPVGLFSFYP